MKLKLLAFFCLAATTVSSAQEVLYKLEGPVVQKDLLIQPADFSKAYVLKLASAFLDESRKANAAKLTVYTNRTTAFLLRGGKGVTDYSYGLWRFEYKDLLPKISAMAEVIKLKDRATLRIRDAGGRVEEVDIRGESLFHGRINDVDYDLLEVTFRKTLPYAATPKVSINFSIVVRQALTADTAWTVSKFIEEQAGINDISLVVRNDNWFIDDESYPWVNPFVPLDRLPTWDEYKDSVSYSCRSKSNDLKCTPMLILVSEGSDH